MTPPDEPTATLLVVDAANVVGARPDGWWRDRLGAATRLARRLDAFAVARPDLRVVLVVEGAARRLDPAAAPAVVVVVAPSSGDDTLVAVVADPSAAVAAEVGEPPAQPRGEPSSTVVVTSDRELAQRVRALGATVHGASWLWDALEGAQPG